MRKSLNNQSNSLILHHFNHLSLELISKSLNENNYRQWSHVIQNNGTVKSPLVIDE